MPQVVVVERTPVAVAPVLEPEKPELDLIGVVHGPLVRMAVFLDQTNHSLVRLRIGQSFRGWTVQGLDTREATLEKAQQQVKLELPARSATTTATAMSPADSAAWLDQ
ncbi:hypothetical protein [Methylocella silvestris]|uniref:hypothetical protein n=1 Tax=Methylocella silvestris TaxID=199596 RepID=UPI0011AF8BFA|nr:hypothetical protein [Methylocella silvestris]